jgi:uncharacterized protein (DUF58 family)
MVRESLVLPSPGIRFRPDFRARLGRLLAHLASARERREGAGRAQLFGVGSEFVGYRPYKSGEDLRALDWNLLARLGRPYVRVAAREASEDWAIVLDTSASMGVGSPGKLQLGAELATALCALALARGATVELVLSGRPRALVARRRAAIEGWMRALEDVRAEGDEGALARARRGVPQAGRLFLIGDFLGGTAEGDPGALHVLARSARELFLARILAREELLPRARGSVRWVDAESGAERELLVDESTALRYESRLGAELELWGRAARAVRAVHGCWTSDTPFETPVHGLCGTTG